jgi:isoleucyl-tRNA synthetase
MQLVGMHVKTKEEGNANLLIVAHLKSEGRMLKTGSIVHKVPYCSRSKTPLIYKAVKSWFIRVDTGVSTLILLFYLYTIKRAAVFN